MERGDLNSTMCGGLRGSALSFVYQRWEAVFRRERMPASIDRILYDIAKENKT